MDKKYILSVLEANEEVKRSSFILANAVLCNVKNGRCFDMTERKAVKELDHAREEYMKAIDVRQAFMEFMDGEV